MSRLTAIHAQNPAYQTAWTSNNRNQETITQNPVEKLHPPWRLNISVEKPVKQCPDTKTNTGKKKPESNHFYPPFKIGHNWPCLEFLSCPCPQLGNSYKNATHGHFWPVMAYIKNLAPQIPHALPGDPFLALPDAQAVDAIFSQIPPHLRQRDFSMSSPCFQAQNPYKPFHALDWARCRRSSV